MRIMWTTIFAMFCSFSYADILPIGSGYVYVDEGMPNDVYDALLNEIEKQDHLTAADDCNMAVSVLVYRAGTSRPLQLLDKSGNNQGWGFKLNVKRLVRSAQTAMSDLSEKVHAAGTKYWSDVLENAINGAAEPDDMLQRIYTDQWEYNKTIDRMTDEETISIRQMESLNGTTLEFAYQSGILFFIKSTFYRGDPNGEKIRIRVGKAPHFSLNAEHSETSIIFDLPNGLIGQLRELGDDELILVRWIGYYSVPEDWQTSGNADAEIFEQKLIETTSYFRAKNLKAALNSWQTGSCMYNYVDVVAD